MPGDLYIISTRVSHQIPQVRASDCRIYPSQEDIRRKAQKQGRQYNDDGLRRSHGQDRTGIGAAASSVASNQVGCITSYDRYQI